MDREKGFQHSKEEREGLIEIIVSKLPEDEREAGKQRAEKIIDAWCGADGEAANILMWAAEKGRFEEYAEKMDGHYEESLQYCHPEARRYGHVPAAHRVAQFAIKCYEEMGVEPVTK